MKPAFLLFIFLAVLGPSLAQVSEDSSTPSSSTQGVRVTPPPARNILPQTINHKPNPVNPPAEIAQKVDTFFAALKTGDYAHAYEGYLNGSRLAQQPEKMSVFISKTQEAFGIYGAMNDFEIFDNYNVGSNVLVLTYFTRHTTQPLRWRFIYYRADKTWTLINMGFDDVLLDLLD